MTTLAQMMRKARLNKDVTIKVVADSIGIAQSHLHAIERGKRLKPKMKVLYALSAYYGLNIDDICVAAYRIPTDVFDKVAKNPKLLNVIRNYPL